MAWDRKEASLGISRGLYKVWSNIVEQYSQCDLTNISDKLIALSAISQEMQKLLDDSYQAGLWRRDMHCGLLWYTGQSYAESEVEKTRYSVTEIHPSPSPSWSWASVQGRIYDGAVVWADESWISLLAEVISVRLSWVNNNPFGAVRSGLLRIRGKLIHTRWLSPWSDYDYYSAPMYIDGKYVRANAYIDSETFGQTLHYGESLWFLPILSVDDPETGHVKNVRGLMLTKLDIGNNITQVQKYRRVGMLSLYRRANVSDGRGQADYSKVIDLMTTIHEGTVITIL